MEVLCPFCDTSNRFPSAVPGQRCVCHQCGREFLSPPQDGSSAAQPPPQTHMTVVGTLNIIMAILNGAWTLFVIGMMIAVFTGSLDAMLAEQGNLQEKTGIGVVYAICGLLSFIQAVLQLLGGIGVLRRKETGRKIALAASVAGAVSIWSCCFYVFSLLVSVYTLIILLRKNAADCCNR